MTRRRELSYAEAMEPRHRDLLRAEAKFISDYCGERALERWWNRLSAAERERLSTAVAPIQEAWQRIVDALQERLDAFVERIAAIIRAFTQVLASALALITPAQ